LSALNSAKPLILQRDKGGGGRTGKRGLMPDVPDGKLKSLDTPGS
jgi:hypothetical protein